MTRHHRPGPLAGSKPSSPAARTLIRPAAAGPPAGPGRRGMYALLRHGPDRRGAVVFSGGVGDVSAPRSRRRSAGELQFRFPGSDWSEFRTVQTDAHGRFRYPYAFSDDSRGVRFQFAPSPPPRRRLAPRAGAPARSSSPGRSVKFLSRAGSAQAKRCAFTKRPHAGCMRGFEDAARRPVRSLPERLPADR